MGDWRTKFRVIPAVYLVLQKENGDVLLLLRKNTGFCDGQYGLPAGHVDGNETLHAAMVREAKEEAGIDIEQNDLELIHTMHRYCGDHERLDFFFVCKNWNGEPQNVEPEKCVELAWYSLSGLPQNTIDYYKQMFSLWQTGKMLSYFGWTE